MCTDCWLFLGVLGTWTWILMLAQLPFLLIEPFLQPLVFLSQEIEIIIPKGLSVLALVVFNACNVIWLSRREFLYWKRTCSYFSISLHSNFPSNFLGTWVLVQTQALFPLLLSLFPSSLSPSQATRTLAARTPKWHHWARAQVGNSHSSSCPSIPSLQTYSLSCYRLPAGTSSSTPPPFSGDAFGVNPSPPSSFLRAFSVFPPSLFPLPFATHWSAKKRSLPGSPSHHASWVSNSKQWTQHPSTKDKTRYLHSYTKKRPQTSWLQVPKSQHKNTNMNNQGNVPPPQASNRIVLNPEKSNSAEEQDKEFKTAIINMAQDLHGKGGGKNGRTWGDG